MHYPESVVMRSYGEKRIGKLKGKGARRTDVWAEHCRGSACSFALFGAKPPAQEPVRWYPTPMGRKASWYALGGLSAPSSGAWRRPSRDAAFSSWTARGPTGHGSARPKGSGEGDGGAKGVGRSVA